VKVRRSDLRSIRQRSLTAGENPGIDLPKMPDAEKQKSVPPRWQDAKQDAADLLTDLPQPAEGTPVYIDTADLDHPMLVLLRAFVRATERAGRKVKLL
jgi:hypothetical protein